MDSIIYDTCWCVGIISSGPSLSWLGIKKLGKLLIYMLQHDEHRKHNTKWKEQATKDHMLYDPIGMKYPEEASPYMMGGCLGLEQVQGERGGTANGYEISFGG